MTYFNYHSKIQDMIKEGNLTCYFFDSNYSKIGFCLVLCFGEKKYPIREYMFEEYFDLIGKYYITTKKENIFYTQKIA